MRNLNMVGIVAICGFEREEVPAIVEVVYLACRFCCRECRGGKQSG
jgi:hypothetical protein